MVLGNSGIVTGAAVTDENEPVTVVTPASLLTVIARPRPRYTFSVCDSNDVGDVTGSTHSGSGVGGGLSAQFGVAVGVTVGVGVGVAVSVAVGVGGGGGGA